MNLSRRMASAHQTMKHPMAARKSKRQRKVRSKSPAAAPGREKTLPAPDLSSFTLGFFEFFGAEIQPSNGGGENSFQISLPPELADHFAKPVLNLVFRNAEVTSDTDLVAYGSRVFDRMMAYLDQQGALTVRQLPKRFGGGEELMQAVQPTNTSILNLRLREQSQNLLVFNWHITYRADDKREELVSVVLDEAGNRLLLQEDGHAQGLSLAGLLADSSESAQETDDEGQPIPPRLPPMTQLARHAQTARKFVLYHADLRCVDHEQEILPRLHKVLSRLTTYYEEQISEVYDSHDPTGGKRASLEEDLQRKIAEEVENHRLRVKVRLFSYALLHVPVATADITLGHGRAGADIQEIPVQVWRNLYDGTLRRPLCHACGQETAQITIDRNGHITCDDCIEQCHTCQDILCASCGVASCPVCGENNCDTCGQSCWACGERACPDHIDACPVCGDPVCHNCQTECGHCGVRQCRSHLWADGVDQQLVCADCAIRCPGCQQYSAQLATCTTSGQRFCTNCAAICTTCQRSFGPGFFHVAPKTGKAYCLEHITICPTCNTIADELRACTVCGELGCAHCAHRCVICKDALCANHAQRFAGCSHVACADHVQSCAIGHERICPLCANECAICERPHCAAHAKRCSMCQQIYCSECVRMSGLCDTCAMIEKEGVRIHMADEPISGHEEVDALARHYNWVRLANHRYVIYLGKGSLGIQALIVADKKRVISVRRQSPLDRILGRSWS